MKCDNCNKVCEKYICHFCIYCSKRCYEEDKSKKGVDRTRVMNDATIIRKVWCDGDPDARRKLAHYRAVIEGFGLACLKKQREGKWK